MGSEMLWPRVPGVLVLVLRFMVSINKAEAAVPHPLSELTNILYLLALVILLLVLIGLHNHRRKLTFIIYLLLADTLSISPLIGM